MILWVGVLVAGGLGAVLRFLVDGAVARRAARSLHFVGLPYGTFVVNISGAALLGLLGALALSRHVALIADTAFVGSYTTFSTWMLETQRLSEEGQIRRAAMNIVASIVLGTAAALLGQWIAGRL
jgi:CrcB protein